MTYVLTKKERKKNMRHIKSKGIFLERMKCISLL